MAAVEIQRTVPTSLAQVWATLSDFAAYGQWIPLTAMRVDPAPKRVGWGFAGKTGLGPVGFLDSMLLTRWEPPAGAGGAGRAGRFTVRKTGRVLAGWADVSVEPTAAGTMVTWREEIVPKPVSLGRLVARATDPVTHRLFATALDRMLAAAQERDRPQPG